MSGSWQDKVFGVSGLTFAVFLLPTLLSSQRPSLVTSIATGVNLAILSATEATLKLRLGATTTGLTAGMWLLIAATT